MRTKLELLEKKSRKHHPHKLNPRTAQYNLTFSSKASSKQRAAQSRWTRGSCSSSASGSCDARGSAQSETQPQREGREDEKTSPSLSLTKILSLELSRAAPKGQESWKRMRKEMLEKQSSIIKNTHTQNISLTSVWSPAVLENVSGIEIGKRNSGEAGDWGSGGGVGGFAVATPAGVALMRISIGSTDAKRAPPMGNSPSTREKSPQEALVVNSMANEATTRGSKR